MTTIIPAKTSANYDSIAGLASHIWIEHYTPILGPQQVAYMLEKFQSALAIREQIKKE